MFYQLLLILFISCVACDVNLADPNYDRAALHALTQYRQQHRKADGKLCAAAFISRMKAYTDCTDSPDPDGGTGREWCYLEAEVAKNSAKPWGYCSPVIDYNLLRVQANEALEAKVNEVDKMLERIDRERNRLDEVIQKFNTTCGIQKDNLKNRIEKIQLGIKNGARCAAKIEEANKKIQTIQETIKLIDHQLQSQKALAMKAPENCALVPGYEDEPQPDGIRGQYFNNVLFKGTPVKRIDSHIDFQWLATDPMTGVLHQEFSVRWEGYIRAPISGQYTFYTEADCGCRLYINNQPIIVDRMPEPTYEDIQNLSTEVQVLPPLIHDGVRSMQSIPITLEGGEKNKIRLEMIHSIHLKWSNSDDASIKLMWETVGLPKSLISKDYFYRSNARSPLKIGNLDPSNYEIDFFYEGIYSYMGDKRHFLADIPARYRGAKFIRTKMRPSTESLKFDLNSPAKVYIASPMNQDIPLVPCDLMMHPTEDIMAVYEADNRDTQAVGTQYMQISRVNVNRPQQFKATINNKDIPFLVFIIQSKQSANACGGQKHIVSLPTSQSFQVCEESSYKSTSYSCSFGLNDRNMDEPYGCWKSYSGNGVGEYVTIRFKKPVQVTEFHFKPLDDPVTWPSELTVSFSETLNEGESQVFQVVHSGNLDDLKFDMIPTITKYIKVEVTQMYVKGEDTGGSFTFYGTECNEDLIREEEGNLMMQNSFLSTETKTFYTVKIDDCSSNMLDVNTPFPLTVGDLYRIECPKKCINNDNSLEIYKDHKHKGNIYGDGEYAIHSSICTAAIHFGICNTNSASSCNILVDIKPGQLKYPSINKNGITSKASGISELSFTVNKYDSIENNETSASINYFVSFRSPNSPSVPESILIDEGKEYSLKNNVNYGWEHPVTTYEFSNQYTSLMNPLNFGGIEFPPASDSMLCKHTDCTPNSWSIVVPNFRKYKVHVQLGNPSKPETGTREYFLQINGINVVNGENLPKGTFYWASQTIHVTNGKISLTALCEKPHCENAVTTIMNIRISSF